MKKVWVILVSLFLITGLILTACSAQSTPIPTSQAPASSTASQKPTNAISTTPATLAKATSTPSSATESGTKPIELKLSHNSPTTANSHVGVVLPWSESIEKATNGRVKITIYPAETLNKAKEAVTAVQSGLTDITWVLTSFFPGRFPLSEVDTLPFLTLPATTVDGRNLSTGAINSRIIQELFDQFPEMQAEWKGMKVLIQHTSAPSQIWTNKKPVRKVSDIKGLKIRAWSSPDVELWKSLGAAPLLMPMPEIYEAAQKGVIDAANVDFGAVLSFRFYEIFKYETELNVSIGRYALVMNEAKWNSLPSDIQKAIMSVSGVAGAEFAGNGMALGMPGVDAVDAVKAKSKEAGKTLEYLVLDPGEFDQFKQASRPIYDNWVAEMAAKGLPGQKVLDALRALLDKYKPR